MRVYVVRHADAGDREAWTEDDRQRPLTGRGRKQAAGLVRLLAGASVARILSSPYLRCVETVEPLGAARNLEVEPAPALAEGSDWHESLQLALAARVATVMCSQGDVIGDLVTHLVAMGLVRPGEARAQKASTWMLTIERGQVSKAKYLSPPAA